MKKIIRVLLAVLMVMSLSVNAFAAEAAGNEYEITIDADTEITVIVPDELSAELNEASIIDLLDGGSFNDGDVITIREIGFLDEVENPEVQPRLFETYKTTTTTTSAEYKCQNFFVISVAKGQTTTLASEFSRTLSVGVTAGDPFVKADIGSSVTAKYTTTHQFTGPAESSAYNSREFRVQFYAKSVSWVQSQYSFTGELIETRSGTANVPTKYLLYSIDHIV